MKLLLTGLCCGLLLGGQIAAAVVHKDSPKVADLQEHNRILRYQVETSKVRQQRMVAQLTSNAPMPVIIHSMQRCQPCKEVMAQYEAAGGKLGKPKPTEIQHATSYPCVKYSDQTWDSGNKILSGQFSINPDVVPVTELVQ